MVFLKKAYWVLSYDSGHWKPALANMKLTMVTQTIPEDHVLKSVTLCIWIFWFPKHYNNCCFVLFLESSVPRSKAASKSQQESFRRAFTEDGL